MDSEFYLLKIRVLVVRLSNLLGDVEFLPDFLTESCDQCFDLTNRGKDDAVVCKGRPLGW